MLVPLLCFENIYYEYVDFITTECAAVGKTYHAISYMVCAELWLLTYSMYLFSHASLARSSFKYS